MKFNIGDSVRYIPGYIGYFHAEIVAFGNAPGEDYIIRFSSGKEIAAREDELKDW